MDTMSGVDLSVNVLMAFLWLMIFVANPQI